MPPEEEDASTVQVKLTDRDQAKLWTFFSGLIKDIKGAANTVAQFGYAGWLSGLWHSPSSTNLTKRAVEKAMDICCRLKPEKAQWLVVRLLGAVPQPIKWNEQAKEELLKALRKELEPYKKMEKQEQWECPAISVEVSECAAGILGHAIGRVPERVRKDVLKSYEAKEKEGTGFWSCSIGPRYVEYVLSAVEEIQV